MQNTPCPEHSKLEQQVSDINTKLDKIDSKIDTIKEQTTESKIDRAWIKKELTKQWAVIWFIIASLITIAIRAFFGGQ